MLRIGLIGFGAISQLVAAELAHSTEIELAGVLVRSGRAHEVASVLAATESLADLLDRRLDIVVECAGQEAVREVGVASLRSGADLMLVSTGALGDPELRERLIAAARSVAKRVLVPAGAIAGLDGLVALRRSTLRSVRYTSAKPPAAWKGTPAEREFDLDGISEATEIFAGSAADAARLYPKNANLAVTIALAGVGLEKTGIRLIADPGLRENVGRIEAIGRLGSLDVEVRGPAAAGNPKTSAITAYSVIAALEGLQAPLVLPV
ncbi:MAG: aspartate dehydrogenase [Thermoleophilia bacterium]|nr:aspartate dehydrogenase [Thermoleophilia bacterium]